MALTPDHARIDGVFNRCHRRHRLVNLEYFPDAGVHGEDELMLLHSGNPDEVARLREALRGLADGRCRRLPLHELPFVHSVHG